jgi:hypothetical protein
VPQDEVRLPGRSPFSKPRPDAISSRSVGILLVMVIVLSPLAASQTVTVRHMGTYARSGMKLSVALTGQATGDQLVVTLGGAEVYRKSGSLTSSEAASFTLGTMAAGDYTMVTSLLNSGGTLRASASETLHAYPRGNVTINEYNSVAVAGSPKFIIAPWLENIATWQPWYDAGEFTGYGWQSDWAATYSPSQYSGMIDTVISRSPLGVIGPGTRTPDGGFGPSPATIATYAVYPTVRDRMLIWYWTDEPDINLAPYGTTKCAAGTGCDQLRAMMQATHTNDSSYKPVITDFYGYDPDVSIASRGFIYPNIVSDIFSFDLYPVIQSHKQSASGLCTGVHNDMGGCQVTFAQWIDAFELIKSYYNDTVPFMPIIEMAGEAVGTSSHCTSGNPCPGPTANQFRMEVYNAVVHGAKGLSMWETWRNPGEPTAAVQAQLTDFMSKLGRGMEGAILAPINSRTATSNQNTPGSRVDAMVREDATNVWVISQRVTDDIANPSEATAPPLSTQLTVSGTTNATATVFDETRTVPVVNGVITDNFDPYATHIYQIPKTAGTPPTAPKLGPPVVK